MTEEKIHELELKASKNETIIDTFVKTTLENQKGDISELKSMINDLNKKFDTTTTALSKEVQQLKVDMVAHDKAGSKDAKWLSGTGISGLSLAVMMVVAALNGWI